MAKKKNGQETWYTYTYADIEISWSTCLYVSISRHVEVSIKIAIFEDVTIIEKFQILIVQ